MIQSLTITQFIAGSSE